MATNFSRVKLIDDDTKLLLHGYINKLNETDIPTPKEIIFICVLYFYQFEQFGDHSKDIIISSTDDTIGIKNICSPKSPYNNGSWKSVHGEYEIDCNKYTNTIFE